MQIPILSGIYTDSTPDFRASYPVNMVPIPLNTGLSTGSLRPTEGLKVFATGGPGVDRGGVVWNGVYYRVMGSKLVSIGTGGAITVLGDAGNNGLPVTFDYSFDRLAIASNGILWYWTGTALTSVTDPDIGNVIDMQFVDGYFMTTDGTHLVVTDLNDPYSVNPLKYGSSELDPDPVMGLIKIRGEIWAMNRNTIEVFRNIGGALFPFQRIDGAQIMRGAIGTFTFAQFLDTVAFLGSGRNESPAVWLASNGGTDKISTREVETVLQGYSEAQLSLAVVEARVDRDLQQLWIHLPNQTLVFDGAASATLQAPVWHIRSTAVAGLSQYRARNLVWVYNAWHVGDPQSTNLGVLADDVSNHYGAVIGWQFGTTILYNSGNQAIVLSLELVGLPGYAAFGADPTIWTSYSLDGNKWSNERPIKAAKFGDVGKRMQWRQCGKLQNWRVQRFRGTSEGQMSFARLEAELEALG